MIGRAPVCLVATVTISNAGATPVSALGAWVRDDGATRIVIDTCGATLCAVNTWVRDPTASEKLGDRLVMSLKQDSPTSWNGDGYDQRRQMNFAMTISLTANGMTTRGCIAMGLLCRSAAWSRPQ
jgi:uncharacterized protein (DUF2147 family)